MTLTTIKGNPDNMKVSISIFKKNVDTPMKWKIIAIAGILGWSPSSANKEENKKQQLQQLICNGMKPISYITFCNWVSSINNLLEGGKDNITY